MPLVMYIGTAITRVIGGMIIQMNLIARTEHGYDWRGYLYTTEIAWLAPAILAPVALLTDDDQMWSRLSYAVQAPILNVVGGNWFALVWSQWERI